MGTAPALRSLAAGLAATLLASACGGSPEPATPRLATGGAEVESRTAWVLEASDMIPAASILDNLRSQFVGMQVRRNGRCPDIIIRGHNSIASSNQPRVYVDGLRASDSCILSTLRGGDVDRVEIYPTGHTRRAGYLSDPNGLVLVFMRSGETE